MTNRLDSQPNDERSRDFVLSAVVRPLMFVAWCLVFWGTCLWAVFLWKVASEGWRIAASSLLRLGSGDPRGYVNLACATLALVTWGLLSLGLWRSRRPR